MIDPVPSNSLRTFLEAACRRYQSNLTDDVIEYLTVERGLTPDSIKRFQLGYVGDPLPGHEYLRGRLAIPYLTPDGSVSTIRFRSLDGSSTKKYLSMPNDPPRIFNTAALERASSGIVICEGEIDAITAEQCGFPTIGIPGANVWVNAWNRLLWQYSVIYVLHDDDVPGKAMADLIGTQLSSVRAIPMIGGDVNSVVNEKGAECFRAMILDGR